MSRVDEREGPLGDLKVGAGGGEVGLAHEEVAVGESTLFEELLAAFVEFLSLAEGGLGDEDLTFGSLNIGGDRAGAHFFESCVGIGDEGGEFLSLGEEVAVVEAYQDLVAVDPIAFAGTEAENGGRDAGRETGLFPGEDGSRGLEGSLLVALRRGCGSDGDNGLLVLLFRLGTAGCQQQGGGEDG